MPADPPPPSGPSSRSCRGPPPGSRPPARHRAAGAAVPRSPPATPCSRACWAIRRRKPACSGCAASTSGPAPKSVPGPPADRVVDRFARAAPRVGRRPRRPGRGPRDPERRRAGPCWPPQATPISPSRAGTSVHRGAPADRTRSACSRRTPTIPPQLRVSGSVDWHDGLAGFMTVFCDAPPDACLLLPATTGPPCRRGGAPHVLAAVADRHRRGARRRPLVPRHRRPARPSSLPAHCPLDVGPLRLVLRRHRADRPGGPCSGPLAAGGVRRRTAEGPARFPAAVRRRAVAPDPARRRRPAPTSTRSSPTRVRLRRRDRCRRRQLSALPRPPARRPDPAVRGRRRRGRAAVGHPPHPERRPPRTRRCSRTASAATRCAATHWPGSAGTTAGCSASAASRSGRTTRRRSWPSASATAPAPVTAARGRSGPGPARRAPDLPPARDRPGAARPPAARPDRASPAAAVPQRPADRRLRGRDHAVLLRGHRRGRPGAAGPRPGPP